MSLSDGEFFTIAVAIDSDGDGVVDLADPDSDNDGILDSVEHVADDPELINGNLDDGVVGVYTAATDMPGWDIEAGNVDWVSPGYIDLTGWALGTISQDVATVPGATYKLSFDYAANENGANQTAVFAAEAFDATVPSLIYSEDFASSDNLPFVNGYIEFTLSLIHI